jgi:hypothetical protein
MPHRRPVIRHSHVGAPHALTSLLEARGLLEMAMLPASLPLLLEAPQGDGHPVLLVPGFMASEASLIGLKLYLQTKGYDVHTWGLGRNMGFRSNMPMHCRRRFVTCTHVTGKESQPGRGGVWAVFFPCTAHRTRWSVCAPSSDVGVAQ